MSNLPKPALRTNMGLRSLRKRSFPFFRHSWAFLLILVAIVAMQASLLAKPIVGVYVTAVSVIALAIAALVKDYSLQTMLSAAVIPVAMMVNLSLPQTLAFAQTTTFYESLLVLGMVYRFIFTLDHPIAQSRLGIKGYIIGIPVALVAGQAVGAIGFGMLRHQYPFGHTSLPLVAAMVVIFAIAEEVVLRGLIQQRAATIMHPALAALLSALLSCVLTIGHHGSWLTPAFGLLLGLVLSATYYIRQNLIITIVLNATTKLVYVGLLAGFVFR